MTLKGVEEKYPHVELVEEREVISKHNPVNGIKALKPGRQRMSIRCWEGGPDVEWNDLRIDKSRTGKEPNDG